MMMVLRWMLAGWLCFGLSSCALIPDFGGNKVAHKVYFIEADDNSASRSPSLKPAKPASSIQCGDLLVGGIRSAPGFGGTRMAYTVQPYQIEYFAYARWADSVGNLLAIPLRTSFEKSAVFSSVVGVPTTVPTSLRLEISDLKLVQRFESRDAVDSVMELSFLAKLMGANPARLIASQRYHAHKIAGPNSHSGAVAANELSHLLIAQLTAFVIEKCH